MTLVILNVVSERPDKPETFPELPPTASVGFDANADKHFERSVGDSLEP